MDTISLTVELRTVGWLYFLMYVLVFYWLGHTWLWNVFASALTLAFICFVSSQPANLQHEFPPLSQSLAAIHWSLIYLNLFGGAR